MSITSHYITYYIAGSMNIVSFHLFDVKRRWQEIKERGERERNFLALASTRYAIDIINRKENATMTIFSYFRCFFGHSCDFKIFRLTKWREERFT